MAVWTRQQNGLFASGRRFAWEFLRDEVAAWRTSLNAVENSQMAIGQAFGNGFLAHPANVSEVRWSLHGAPARATSFNFTEARLLPVGAFRCPADIAVRHVAMSIASVETDGYPFQAMVLEHWAAGSSSPNPAGIPQALFTIRLIDRDRALVLQRLRRDVSGNEVRRAGDIMDPAEAGLATIISSPVSIATRVGTSSAVYPAVGGPDRVLPSPLTEEPTTIFMSDTLFRTGDVLIGVIDMPALTGEQRVARLMGFCSVRIEFARRHAV